MKAVAMVTFAVAVAAIGGGAIHPFGHVKRDNAAPLLQGAAIEASLLAFGAANGCTDEIDVLFTGPGTAISRRLLGWWSVT